MKLFDCLKYFRGMIPGEPIYALVVLRGTKTYIAACLFPNPLEAYGKESRHVSMEFLLSEEPMYVVRGKNFEPEEKITMFTHAHNNTYIDFITASEEGSFMFFLQGDQSEGELGPESLNIFTPTQMNPMRISYSWQCWNFLQKMLGKNLQDTR